MDLYRSRLCTRLVRHHENLKYRGWQEINRFECSTISPAFPGWHILSGRRKNVFSEIPSTRFFHRVFALGKIHSCLCSTLRLHVPRKQPLPTTEQIGRSTGNLRMTKNYLHRHRYPSCFL